MTSSSRSTLEFAICKQSNFEVNNYADNWNKSLREIRVLQEMPKSKSKPKGEKGGGNGGGKQTPTHKMKRSKHRSTPKSQQGLESRLL